MHMLHTYITSRLSMQSGGIILKVYPIYYFWEKEIIARREMRGQSSHSKSGILLTTCSDRKSAGNLGLTRMRITQ
jgi:hypothetical protein